MDELAKRFADLAQQYGPTVVDAAKGAAVVSGYSMLVGGAVALIVAAALAYGAKHFWHLSKTGERYNCHEIPATLLTVGAVIAAIIGCLLVLDPWTWVAINQPDLWLAKRALGL